MNLPPSNTKTLYGIAIVAVALLCLSVSLNVWQALQPKGTLTCASFGSYKDAEYDFLVNGNSLLDGDKDEIPCESLLQ